MVKTLLQQAIDKKASDVHLIAGIPPVFRLNGSLVRIDGLPLTGQDILALFRVITSTEQQQRFYNNGELDFSFEIAGIGRFRVHAYYQRSLIAIAIRVVNNRIPNLEELGMPEVIKSLARMPRGLVLVTGPTGSGKSTTLAAIVDLINSERAAHVLTLEAPIEYLHCHRKCIVSQREIPTDSKSFANALRAALREDPDVILIGEMRDAETIGIAVTAAETGHLVFATLHTCNAAQTVDRIIDVFPSQQQQQIRVQLSLTLQGIVSQQLLPRSDGGGRVVALEILIATPAICNLIREGKTHQIASVIQTGSKLGMQSIEISLRDLYRQGIISYEAALEHSVNPEIFKHLVNG